MNNVNLNSVLSEAQERMDHYVTSSTDKEETKLTGSEKIIGRMLEIIDPEKEKKLNALIEEEQELSITIRKTRAPEIKKEAEELQKTIQEEYAQTKKFIKAVSGGQFKYIMALDTGCGNTSACVYEIGSAEVPVRLIEWDTVDREHNMISEKSIKTILGFKKKKDDSISAVIGTEAFDYGEAAQNFKTIPDAENLKNITIPEVGVVRNITHWQVWQEYFSEIFRQALKAAKQDEHHYSGIEENNILLVVGHPADSQWKPHLKSYKELICEGTHLNLNQVLTISEAKASMQYVHRCRGEETKDEEKREKMELPDWEKGVLIIDLGASTIDIMYLAFGQEMREWSINMAGGDVDDLLGHKILSYFYPQEMQNLENQGLEVNEIPGKDFFWKHHNEMGCSGSQFLHRVRLIKEDVCVYGHAEFKNKINDKTETFEVFKKNIGDLLSSKVFGFNCRNTDIAKFMNDGQDGHTRVDGTFYDNFQKFLEYVLKELITEGLHAETVIATGGTANLVGIEDCIDNALDTFRWTQTKTVIMKEPGDYERTVPCGAASYINTVIVHMSDIVNFPWELREILKKDLLSFCPDKIVPPIRSVLGSSIYSIYRDWFFSGDECSSIAALKSSLRDITIDEDELFYVARDAKWEIDRISFDDAFYSATRNYINEFLAGLSINKVYDHNVNVKNIDCKIDMNLVEKIISAALATESVYKRWKHPWSAVKNAWSGEDTPLSSGAKYNIFKDYEDFLNEIDIQTPVKETFSEKFYETDGFGIVDQIMDGIELDINQAMFI